MNNKKEIVRWLVNNQEDALHIAAHAVMPLLLDADGDWIGETDFPSGADYIEQITYIMESVGLYRHITNLQENGKSD